MADWDCGCESVVSLVASLGGAADAGDAALLVEDQAPGMAPCSSNTTALTPFGSGVLHPRRVSGRVPWSQGGPFT